MKLIRMQYLKSNIGLTVIVLLMSISSCKFFVNDGYLGASGDIKGSKAKGVFVYEYLPPKNPYRINDSLVVHVKSAWLEHQWRYDEGLFREKAKIEKDGYQLIVTMDEQNLKGFDDKWLIGLTGDSSFRFASHNAIITDFKELPTTDTIIWKVQSGRQLAKSIPKTIIGKFTLVVVK